MSPHVPAGPFWQEAAFRPCIEVSRGRSEGVLRSLAHGDRRENVRRHSIQALLSAYRKRLSGYMQLAVYAVVAPDAIDAGLVPLAFVAVTVQV